MEDYLKVRESVMSFIKDDAFSDDEFDRMAKELFVFQYEHNQPFRKFCRKRRVSPAHVQHFTDIPPVPINAFKEVALACSPAEEAEAIFITSGTTNKEKRGKNIHRDLDTWNLSMETYFKKAIIPDLAHMRMVVLFPTSEEMPNSSLAHYLHLAKEKFGTKNSEYVVSKEGMDTEKLTEILQETVQNEEPILLIGATFSFIHFLDECMKKGTQFQLPKGSCVMDTGGAKGRSREMSPMELKENLSKLLSIPAHQCMNMYGMTELSSQLYDRPHANGLLVPPHWMRTLIVDPETMQEKPEGEQGIIVHYDLANLNSVVGIMTEDVGIKKGDGFYLLGRAQGAEAKGCSLAVEQFISSARGD